MPYIATNETDRRIAVRDESGKHFLEPGDTHTIRGDAKAPNFGAAGLTVVWDAGEGEKQGTEPEPGDEDVPEEEKAETGKRRARVTAGK